MKEKTLDELRAEAMPLEPIVRIGKAGLTESVVNEIKKQLKKKNMIKVKMLKSFISRKDKKKLADEIASKTESVLVHRVGFAVVLAKKPKTI